MRVPFRRWAPVWGLLTAVSLALAGLALVPAEASAASCAPVVNESQLQGPFTRFGLDALGDNGYATQFAQTFTAGQTGQLTMIQVYLYDRGSMDLTLVNAPLHAPATSNGPFTGTNTALATAQTLVYSQGWARFALNPPVAVTAGTQYAFILSPQGPGLQALTAGTDPSVGGGIWPSNSSPDASEAVMFATTYVVGPQVAITGSLSGARGGAANGAGWYNQPVQVTLTASACQNLASLTYAVNGGTPVVVPGSTTGITTSFTLATDGVDTVDYSTTTSDGSTASGSLVAQIDTSPPTVNLSFTPNGSNGWFTTPTATGAVTASDAISGVATLGCTVDGSSVAVGTGGALAVSGEGTHTVTCIATNNAGLQSTQTAAVKIDSQPPATPTFAFTPNGSNGWFTGSPAGGTVSATDATSGVAFYTCTDNGGNLAVGPGGALSLTGDGTHAISCTATDNAGNQSAAATTTVKVDATPPTLDLSFTPNGSNGWFTTPTATGAVTASDAISGVATLGCTVDGSPVALGTGGALAVNGEGTHTVSCTATDNAGNQSTATATVRIDSTAPEASLRLAPPPSGTAPHLAVTGSDTGSDPTTVTPAACTTQGPRHGPGDHRRPAPTVAQAVYGPDHGPQICKWTVTDQAGNALTLTALVRTDRNSVQASILTLTYTTGAGSKTVRPANNSLDFHWSLDHKTNALQQLDQQVQVQGKPGPSGDDPHGDGHLGPRGPLGPIGPAGGQRLQAHYDARQNVTVINTGPGDHSRPQKQSGLVLLVVTTSAGQLGLSI